MDSTSVLTILGLFTWVACCLAVGYVASTKGRDETAMFFVSLFLSPLVGALVVMGAPKDNDQPEG